MYRNSLIKLEKWLRKSPRKPLVIRGARQVGKSTLVRQFAEHAGLQLVEINLERYPNLDREFESFDIPRIINALEALPKVPKISKNSLLFLDEIQATPHALAALRYFYEDLPEQPVLCAGSLLEFVLSDHEFSIPVGRIEYLHLGPMSFCEFLLAVGENQLLQTLQELSFKNPVSEHAHQRLVELFRKFCFVGGMPEAVMVFSQRQNFSEVRDVHRSIIDTFKDDFTKYARKEALGKLHLVFDHAARAVGKKMKYVNISREDNSRTIKTLVDLLTQARVISKVYHSHAQGLPLSADIDTKVYKTLFLDVGLMNAVCGLEWTFLSRMDGFGLINAGSIAEQFVGQELIASALLDGRHELNYWLREGKEGNAEVDYLISFGGQIIPVEVKAGKSGTLKSLPLFAKSHPIKLAIRLDLNVASYLQLPINGNENKKVKGLELYSLPIYSTGEIARLFAGKEE